MLASVISPLHDKQLFAAEPEQDSQVELQAEHVLLFVTGYLYVFNGQVVAQVLVTEFK